MAGQPGQPAPKPNSITSPVPGAEAHDEADAFLADFSPPPAPANAAPAGDEADQFLASVQAESPAPAPPGDDQFAPDSQWNSLGDIARDNINQFKPENFITRLQAGLAANDNEKKAFLAKKYGDENVAMKNGKLYYRKEKGEKLKPLDPATFELIADIIPDFAREIVTEAAMVPGELGGVALGAKYGTEIGALGGGAVAGPPGIVAGGLAGFTGGSVAGGIAARAASVPHANYIADKVAEAAGVPRDPERSALSEDLMGSAAEVVLPFLGKTALKYGTKYIPGTAAYKAAKAAGQREVVALDAQGREFLKATQELAEEGKNLAFGVQNVQTNSPKVAEMVGKVADSGSFQNKQIEVADGFRDLLGKVKDEIVRRVNPSGAKVAKGELAPTITNAVTAIEQAEGKAIGQFRTQALATLKNQKQQLPPETSEFAIEMMKELGFQPKRVKSNSVTRVGSPGAFERRGAMETQNQIERVNWSPSKNIEKVIGSMGLKDAGEVRAVSNVLNEVGQLVSNGNEARLTDVERVIGRLGPLSDRLQGTQAGAKLGKLTSELRKHRREIIGNALEDPTDKVLFNRTMDDFSALRSSKEQLSSALRDDVTAKTIVGQLFRGKENLANVRAIKTILGDKSGTYGALKEEFVSQLFEKHAASNKTGINAEAFLKDLRQTYGDDFIKEVGLDVGSLKNALTAGAQLERTFKAAGADSSSEQAKQAAANTMVGFIGNYGSRMFDGVKNLLKLNSSKENTVLELFNRDGFEKYIAGLPPKKRGAVAGKIEELMAQYNSARAADTKVNALLDTGKDLAKRGARATLREDAMRRD
jgi:hypothetical protein